MIEYVNVLCTVQGAVQIFSIIDFNNKAAVQCRTKF